MRLTKSRQKQKKPKQPVSRLQALWQRAEALQQQNATFRQTLDALVSRLEKEILPVERDANEAEKLLLQRLLVLGRRKSWCAWEREELATWILALHEQLLDAGLMDASLDDECARYEAYSLGLVLDEDSEMPLAEQVQQQWRQIAEEMQAPFAGVGAVPPKPASAMSEAAMREEVERRLDRYLGPAPKITPVDAAMDDMFAEEKQRAERERSFDYQEARERLRPILYAEIQREQAADSGSWSDGSEFDYFDGDGRDDASQDDAGDEDIESDTPAKRPVAEIVQRLFRAAAAVLHPDREADDARRAEKQHLMSELLRARKSGDISTILTLYKQHVGIPEGLEQSEETVLVAALQAQIEELEMESGEYVLTSPLHQYAYECFYSSKPGKVDKAIRARIREINESSVELRKAALGITSIATLRPYLRARNTYAREEYYSPYGFDD